MPLKRTPPSTPHQTAESDKNQSSAQATDTENEGSNVTTRQRPRRRQNEDEITVFMAQMKKSIETLTQQQDVLHESIRNIEKQNNDIISSMDFISKQYEDVKDKLSKMEIDRKNNLVYIQNLEQKVENLERAQRQASIEIRNIPVMKKESKQDLTQLVKKVGESVNICVEETQIRDVFRLKTKKENNQPIIVDFTTVTLKEKLLTSIKTYNKSRDTKLNTSDLKIDGQQRPVFVSEMLTQSARNLYFHTRQFSKEHGYKYCWTAHGKIFLRKEEGAPSRRIDAVADLSKLLHPNDK